MHQAGDETSGVRGWEVAALLAVTLVAAVLRLAQLDSPAVWGDEAATWSRIFESWQPLLNELRRDGFVPLHYVVYFWLSETIGPLVPWKLRLVPAVAGMLFVPGLWLLTRQLVGRREALVAATLAATSAYLLVYSRDAKMYMHFWTAAVWSTAALVWWLRSHRRVAWWAWVASGCVMLGLHFTGTIVLGVQVVFVLCERLRWWTLPAFGLGVGLMLIGPVYHYGLGEPGDWWYVESFNGYFEQAERRGDRYGGLGWIDGYNWGREGGGYLLFTLSAYTTGWEWPQAWFARFVEPTTLRVMQVATAAVFFALGLGVVAGGRWPGWRAMVPVLAWAVLPVVAVYRLSVEDAAIDGMFLLLVSGGLALVAAVRQRQADGVSAAWSLPAVTLLAAGVAFATEPQGHSLWMPRYIGLMWPALAILAAVAVMRLPGWGWRSAAVGVFVVVNLGQFSARVLGSSEPPVDVLVADILDVKHGDGRTLVALDYRLEGRPEELGPVNFPDPGRAWIDTTSYAYYLQTTDPDPAIERVREVRGWGFGRRAYAKYDEYHTYFSPGWEGRLASSLDARDIDRFVVWQARPPFAEGEPVYGGPLGDVWERVSVEHHPVRDHWRWVAWYELVRYEFRRVE